MILLSFDFDVFKKLLKHGFFLYLSSFCYYFVNQTSAFYIAKFISLKETGLYSFSMSIASIITLFMIGFNQNVVHPMKAFWIRDDIKVMRLFIYQGSNNLIKENLHIINDSKGAVYLMTVDSHMKEISIVNEIRQQKNPIHTIKHKQQVILEIFKLK